MRLPKEIYERAGVKKIKNLGLTFGVLALDDAAEDERELEVESSPATALAICKNNKRRHEHERTLTLLTLSPSCAYTYDLFKWFKKHSRIKS